MSSLKELRKLENGLYYVDCLNGYKFIFDSQDGSWIISNYLPSENEIRNYLPNMKSESYIDVRDIVLNTTNKCNLACKYCYVGEHNEKNLTYEMGKKIIDKLIQLYGKRDKPIEICLHGSEPLENWDVLERLILYGEEKNKIYNKKIVKFGLQTNATQIDEERAIFLKDHDVGVGVSLDGPEKFHNLTRHYRNGQGSFEDVINGIKILNKFYGKVNALCVVSKYNVNQLDEVYEWFKNCGYFEKVRFLFVHPDKYGRKKEYLPDIKTLLSKYIPIFVEELERVSEGKSYFLNNVETRIINFILPKVKPICGRCANTFIQPAIYVDLDGTVKECDSIGYSRLSQHSLFEFQKIEEILNSENNFRVNESSLLTSCRNCPLQFFCGGGCPSEVIENRNYYCEVYRREYIEIMKRAPYLLKIVKERE